LAILSKLDVGFSVALVCLGTRYGYLEVLIDGRDVRASVETLETKIVLGRATSSEIATRPHCPDSVSSYTFRRTLTLYAGISQPTEHIL
jgi:hypothetical protein